MAVESSSSSWWPLSPPWLSPGAAWFVLFSVVVGAVAVMPRAPQAPPSSSTGCSEAEEEDSINLDEAHPVVASRPPPQAATAAETAAMEEKPSKRREAAKAAVAVKWSGRAFAEEAEGQAEVNARAERFIRQFREDLRLQRLMSVLNRTHTLNGGGGGGASPAP